MHGEGGREDHWLSEKGKCLSTHRQPHLDAENNASTVARLEFLAIHSRLWIQKTRASDGRGPPRAATLTVFSDCHLPPLGSTRWLPYRDSHPGGAKENERRTRAGCRRGFRIGFEGVQLSIYCILAQHSEKHGTGSFKMSHRNKEPLLHVNVDAMWWLFFSEKIGRV